MIGIYVTHSTIVQFSDLHGNELKLLLTPESLYITQPNSIESDKIKIKKSLIKHMKSIFTLYATGCLTHGKVITKD